MPLEAIKVCRIIDRSKAKVAKIFSLKFLKAWKVLSVSSFLTSVQTTVEFSAIAAFIQLCIFLRSARKCFYVAV